jgi:hypothetical protein
MSRKRTIVVGILLSLSVALSGCKKKKPPVPAPKAQAPTITDTNVPAAIPEVPVPQPTPEAPPTKPASTDTKKTKPRKIEAKKNPPATPPAPTSADKVVIGEGSKPDPAAPPPLVADEAHNQAAQQRWNTNQLLGAAEYNINNIHRTLSTDEQAIVQHIRGFIEQSRQALKDGDTERAHTLAIKAHLMSDELIKK